MSEPLSAAAPAPHVPNIELARQKVAAPAIALMVLGGVGMTCTVAAVLFANSLQRLVETGEGTPPIPFALSGPGFYIELAVFFACNVVITFGGFMMKQLKSRNTAFAASLIAVVPCVTLCCLGMPIGAWSLMVLSDPNVKASFH